MFILFLNDVTTASALLIGSAGAIILILKLFKRKIPRFILRNGFLLGFIISVGALVMSILYSDVVGYPPCKLCWLQRIFIYPQVIIFGLALWKRYPAYIIRTISLWLTGIGAVISLYHNFIYYTDYSPLPCDATVSCTQHLVSVFGFISIPFMALCAFVGLWAVGKILPKE